ncbi:hypothetical protein GCM10022243_17560 [Saccharothrix violaceirubra]|uniref:Amino acid transporter n=1 Tax=Saccharothrix violaceirubra TaxID=413306 RepID=A0A7W7WTU5_9PSEU|nr:hypothetical protein [Saccharothrix violaceirubra]MBB4963499.1 amino acid transporter [Saccharothrix violaceirubra]
MNDTTTAAIAAMLMAFVLGLVGLLSTRRSTTARPRPRPRARRVNWGTVIVGLATIISTVLAAAAYLRG